MRVPRCHRSITDTRIDFGAFLRPKLAGNDCSGRPAHHYIVIYGQEQWLCGVHYDDHIATRSFMYMDGENLDERGNAL